MTTFFVIKRLMGEYIADDGSDTEFVMMARRYPTKKRALDDLTMLDLRTSLPIYPGTCVCGPYSTDNYGGLPG